MAQLSDDCFAFGGPLMSVDEAVAIIAQRLTAVDEVESVDLLSADGRFLAAPITAPMPLPPFMNSAVDGYAVRSADLPQGSEKAFAVSGRVQAGAAAPETIAPGEAVRIFTGAPMPGGADTVFMQEDVRIDDAGRVVLPAGLKPGANVRPAGEDIPAGPRRAAGRASAQAAGRGAGGGAGADADRGAAAAAHRGLLHRQRGGLAGRGARGHAAVRFQSLHADGDAEAARLRGQRSRHPARRPRPACGTR